MKNWTAINLSSYHAGQIVTPCVSVRSSGKTQYDIRWCWRDSSMTDGQPGHTYGEGQFRGSYWECVQILKAEGIFTNDQRF
jgi:hypothetical protein